MSLRGQISASCACVHISPFEEMSQRWRAVGHCVRFDRSETFRFKNERVTPRPIG